MVALRLCGICTVRVQLYSGSLPEGSYRINLVAGLPHYYRTYGTVFHESDNLLLPWKEVDLEVDFSFFMERGIGSAEALPHFQGS